MKTDRLLAITLYLLNRKTVSASALAERFEVSKRTIQRDIDALNQAGVPIISTRGVEGGNGVVEGFSLSKQLAGVDDALNIVIALKGLISAYENKSISATLEKALAAARGGEQRIFVDFTAAREEGQVNERLQGIHRAICDQTLLKLVYSDAQGEISQRTVEPLALSYQWYAWYLFAYCRSKQDYRLFKLPRIVDLAPIGGAFSKAHGNVEALMNAVALDERKHYRILLRCKREIRQQALEYLGNSIVEELENGDFILRLSDVPMERMWFSLLMGFGDQVEVLEPEKLRAMLREKALELLSIY